MNHRVSYTLTAIAALAITSQVHAQYNILNNFIGSPSSLVSRPVFGVIQVFDPTNQSLNATVAQEFSVSSAATIMDLGIAFETSHPSAISLITGVRISVWSSLNDASNSTNALNQLVVGSVDVLSSNIAFAQISGANSNSGNASVAVIGGINIQLPSAGTYYLGAAFLLNPGSNFAQTYILSNSTINNVSNGVNPGNGWGMGTITAAPPVSAAYGIGGIVPEPLSSVALGLSLVALARRRCRRTV